MLDDAAHQVDGDRKADAFGSRVLRKYRRVNADKLAATVDQCAAGITGIDSGIGLNEVFKRHQVQEAAPGSADDALGHGGCQAIGVADCEHDIADSQCSERANLDGGQVRQIDFEQGQVRFSVDADRDRFRDASVAELHANFGRRCNNVVIGDEIALRVDDDGRGEAGIDSKRARASSGARVLNEAFCVNIRYRCRSCDRLHRQSWRVLLIASNPGHQVRADEHDEKRDRQSDDDRLQ